MRRSAAGIASPAAPCASTPGVTSSSANAATTSARSSSETVSSSATVDAVGREAAEVDPAVEGGTHHQVGAQPGRAAPPRCRRSARAPAGSRAACSARASSTARSCTVRAMRRIPSGPVPHRVHRRHHRQQHLRRADVAGGLVAADVLLAGLQRHPERGVTVGVLGDADDPARECAACRRPSWRRTPRADRRSPAARRSAANCRRRCRRPTHPAG